MIDYTTDIKRYCPITTRTLDSGESYSRISRCFMRRAVTRNEVNHPAEQRVASYLRKRWIMMEGDVGLVLKRASSLGEATTNAPRYTWARANPTATHGASSPLPSHMLHQQANQNIPTLIHDPPPQSPSKISSISHHSTTPILRR